jgi:hypothetical protein
MEKEFLTAFLPDKILEYFTLIKVEQLGLIETKTDCFYIYLEEKNKLPVGYNTEEYESKRVLYI